MLRRLLTENVRNLTATSVSIDQSVCVITGNNGAGKTSFLEAIHILGTGRSFRTNQIINIINRDKDKITVFGELANNRRLGVERNKAGEFQVRINQENQQRMSTLAQYLPVRVMTPESFLMMTAGAQARRQFLDFAVFHLEHSFSQDWQNYNKLLKQRNALLKQSKGYDELKYWDNQIITITERINSLRNQAFEQLLPHFEYYQYTFLPQYKVQYSLKSGVDSGDLSQQFIDSYSTDCRYGFTTIGPHKADIRVRIDKQKAHQVLSRGELKLLVASLIMGQIRWLLEREKYCCLLIDDLASELDTTKQGIILDKIVELKGLQTFITSINQPDFFNETSLDYQMFHVEHGHIRPDDVAS